MKKENILLLSVILVALVIRIYLFVLSSNTPLWWDETEYLNIARTFATGILLPSLGIVRPILLSLIISPLYRITNSLSLVEDISRLLMIIFSMTSVLGFYLCGKEMYNKTVGIIAAFFIGVFSLGLILTTKILTDIPSFYCFVLGVYLFYMFLKYKQSKYIYFSSVAFAIGTLFKMNVLPMFFILLIVYAFKKDIKIKELLISLLIFILLMIPYIIYGYVVYNNFVFTGAPGYVSSSAQSYLTSFIFNMTNYIITLIKYIFFIDINYQIASLILVLLILIALITMKKNLFIVLIIAIPFITTSLFIGHGEDRYIIYCMLGIFLLMSSFMVSLTQRYKNKTVLTLVVLLIILWGSVQIYNGYERVVTYAPANNYVKEVGFWLRDNLSPEESAIATNPMQMSYYSNKYIYWFEDNKNKTDAILKEKNIEYFIIFKSEVTSDWMIQYNLTMINNTKDFVLYKYSK